MSSVLNPGVVTGQDYIELIKSCKEGGYALPAVNVTNSVGVTAVLAAAAANKSDVIIQLSNGGAAFFGTGNPDEKSLDAKIFGGIAAADFINGLAKHYGVCVVLHTDHADRANLPWLDGLLAESERRVAEGGKPLYSSHMIDLSAEPAETNLMTCAAYLERMLPLGMGLEIELGVTGGEEDGIGHDDGPKEKLYTNPDDAAQACEILWPIIQKHCEETGLSFEDQRNSLTVALSFGNIHGVYEPGNVKLTPTILRDCQQRIKEVWGTGDNPLPLVFHGGSGSKPEEFREAIGYGVVKTNIDTDTQFVFSKAVYDRIKKKPRAYEVQIDPDTNEKYKKEYDPRKILGAGQKGMIAYLTPLFELFGAAGHSLAQTPAQGYKPGLNAHA